MADLELEMLPDDVLPVIADHADLATARSLHQVSRRWRRACQERRVTRLLLQSDQLGLSWDQKAMRSFCNVSGLQLQFMVVDLDAVATCLQLMRKLTTLSLQLVTSPNLRALLPVVSTLTALEELQLGVSGLPVDLGPLAALPQLKVLEISTSEVDFATLASLTALRSLALTCWSVKNMEQATALAALQDLTLNALDSLDVGPLGALSTLRKLKLRRVTILDTFPLIALTALQTLCFRPTIESAFGVRFLTALESLEVLRVPYTTPSIWPLTVLTGLQELDLSSTLVADTTPLTGFKLLRKLDLSWKGIERDDDPMPSLTTFRWHDKRWKDTERDLSPLGSLRTLRELDLGHTLMPSLSVLTSLVALSRLDLRGIDLASVRPLTALAGLQELHLTCDRVQEQASLSVLTAVNIVNEKDSGPSLDEVKGRHKNFH